MMRWIEFSFLILFSLLSVGKSIGQEEDLCHYSNYDNNIFQYIFRGDLENVKSVVEVNGRAIWSKFGRVSITPFEYSILMHQNSITEFMFNQLERRKKRRKKFTDSQVKMAILSGNAFALEMILHKSKIKSLNSYNKNLVDFLIGYEFSEIYPGKKSLCFKAISKSSTLELVEIFFKRANKEGRANLSQILIKECSEFLAKNENKLLSYITVNENNLEGATIGLINTMEDEYEQGIQAYATILSRMLESCLDENMFNAVYTELLTYCIKNKDRNAYEEFEKLGLFEPLKMKTWN